MFRTVIVAVALIAVAPAAARQTGAAHDTSFAWSEIQAINRVTVGRFAARYGVAHANCLGTGPASGPSYRRLFRHFDCELLNKQFDNERQIVLHVTGETTFKVQWLTMRRC